MTREQSEAASLQLPLAQPWRDGDLMETLYVENLCSANEISDIFDCSSSTVLKWLDKHGIEKRTRSEAQQNMHGALGKANYNTSRKGYEYWGPGNTHVYVHRLAAVAWFGFDEVRDKHVHHDNGIEFDNREENLEVVTNAEHQKRHTKFSELERIRMAELYRNGDVATRGLAEALEYDISYGSVLRIVQEMGCET